MCNNTLIHKDHPRQLEMEKVCVLFSENVSMQHYIYDASGERVLKTNSEIEYMPTDHW